MGFSPGEKHYTTTSIFSNIVDAASGSFTEGLTVSGTPVTGHPQYIRIQDEKSGGTSGGTFTSGAWRTRNLNTIAHDDTGEITVSSNQFTLPAGTYEVSIAPPCLRVDFHRARLQNITDTATVFYGQSCYGSSNADAKAGDQTAGELFGKFTISAPKVFEVQHRCTTTMANNGFGTAGESIADPEIFTQVQLWKLS